MISSTILYNIGPYFYKLFVDAIPSLDYSKLVNILIIYIGIRVLASLLGMVSFTLGDIVAIHSSKNIRARIFKYVQDLDFAFHASKSTGSLISTFRRSDGAYWSIYQAIHHRLFEILISLLVMTYFFQELIQQLH